MSKMFDLYTGASFNPDAFWDIQKNITLYTKKLEKYLKKKYKTLAYVNREPAGHISIKFIGKQSQVKKDVDKFCDELRSKGVPPVYIWLRGIHTFGDTTVGLVESLSINVLSAYYNNIKK